MRKALKLITCVCPIAPQQARLGRDCIDCIIIICNAFQPERDEKDGKEYMHAYALSSYLNQWKKYARLQSE